jgi:hypothetical protein
VKDHLMQVFGATKVSAINRPLDEQVCCDIAGVLLSPIARGDYPRSLQEALGGDLVGASPRK